MGWFDKIRSAKPAAPVGSVAQADTSEPEALRLIDEGNAFEESGHFAEALQRYEAAVERAPNLARAYLNRGNVRLAMNDADRALADYAAALAKNPDYAAAHYNTGNAYVRTGRGEAALPAYRRAIALNPEFADAEVALASALEDLGKPDEAIASYQRALTIRPDYAEVHNNLGMTLKRQGRLDAAVASYRRALELQPEIAEVHYNLGEALQQQAELAGAAASYRRALEIDPGHMAAQNNLGNVLLHLGEREAAVASLRRVVQSMPDSAEAHSNLGNALNELGEFDAAIATLHRAREINPGLDAVHYNLGNALQSVGKLHAAIESFRRALALNPGNSDAHCNLGNALYEIGMLDDAGAAYRRTLEQKPDHALAHSNLGNVLTDQGRADLAAASYRRAFAIDPDNGMALSNLLFGTMYRGDQGGPTMVAEARTFGAFAATKARPHAAWDNDRDPERRLRIGIVSGDLRNHAVGHFIKGALAALASTAAREVEVVGYPTHHVEDDVTAGIKASCSGWHPAVRLSDAALAGRIREDRIDILIDVAGHSRHNRLTMFAWKPAPVQATWLGYLATTGVAAIDYVIADRLTLPESDEANFTERIWRLPESYLCFTPPDMKADVVALPALSAGHITFGSFNNLTKVNDDVVAVWARVLRAVPGSRLFLKAKQLAGAAVRQRMIDRFAAHAVGQERLLFSSFAPQAEYLLPYQQVDIALDPFPYTGITTTVESLWMGVPVLTLAGTTFLSRQGVGLMTNAGIPDWIAVNAEDYVARASTHAGDVARLASLRSGLRQQVLASPIFDTERFAGHFAAAMRGMWQQWLFEQQGGAA